MEKVKTVAFPEIPEKVWKRIYPQILEAYKGKIKEHFLRFGESYLKRHRSDNDEFYGLNATLKRLPLVIMDLLEECEINEVDPNAKTGSLSYTGRWKIIHVNFTDVKWFMLRDLFKFVKFIDKNKPTFYEFYDRACKISGCTLGVHVLVAYSNLLTPVPVKNNENGARQLEKSLRKKFPDL